MEQLVHTPLALQVPQLGVSYWHVLQAPVGSGQCPAWQVVQLVAEVHWLHNAPQAEQFPFVAKK